MIRLLAVRFAAPIALALSSALMAPTAQATELVGWALLPANTFAVGPTSGQFAGGGAGGNSLPLIDKQPVQGISAVLPGPTRRSFYVMPDNGFGSPANSADALLRIYAVAPDFRHWERGELRGTGAVGPAEFVTGRATNSFTDATFISLSDPKRALGFSLVADKVNYPNGAGTVPVAAQIQRRRLLTGADFDIEAVRKDAQGNFWFGDELGPFLVQTDGKGVVLRAEVSTPNLVPPGSISTGTQVRSPQNPYLGSQSPNLGASRGFEGMAIDPSGRYLYPLLEGTVTGDDAIDGSTGKILRIGQFDTQVAAYTGQHWLYRLESEGTNIGDMTAVNETQFLVIERDSDTATTAGVPFKKIFLVDIAGVASGGFVTKRELVDLMNIADPHDLDADGSTQFTFPYVTIESVLILNPTTLLVINDNNYPGTGGRSLNSDDTEFLKLRLDSPLTVTTSR